ncbi:hypothetical protein V1527DRAFT_455753, partial [Lipomyces starkeyi]
PMADLVDIRRISDGSVSATLLKGGYKGGYISPNFKKADGGCGYGKIWRISASATALESIQRSINGRKNALKRFDAASQPTQHHAEASGCQDGEELQVVEVRLSQSEIDNA